MAKPMPIPAQMRRELVLSKLTNEQGKPLVIQPFYLEAFAALDDPKVREVLLWCIRQSGKSTFLAALAISHLLTTPGGYVIFVSASENQAGTIFHRKIRRPLERLFRGAKLSATMNVTKRSLEYLPLGSALEVVAPNESTAPGRSPTLLIMDEARDIPDEVFLTLAPSCIGAGGKIVIASSAGRPAGFFYESVTQPSPESVLIHRDVNDNPFADQGMLAWLRRRFGSLSQSAASRELENQFTEDTDSFLRSGLIDGAIDDALGEVAYSEDEAFGFIDLSRKQDLTSRVVITRSVARRPEVKDHLTVASIRVWNPKTSVTKEVDFAEVREDLAGLLARFPNLRLVLVDEGAEAGAVLQWAKTQPHLNLRVHGFIASVSSNMDLWSSLAARLHGQTLSIPRHERLLVELRSLRQESFSFGSKWRIVDSSKKFHRDVSLALAGAVLAATTRPKLEVLRILNPENRSVDEQKRDEAVYNEARRQASIDEVARNAKSGGYWWPG